MLALLLIGSAGIAAFEVRNYKNRDDTPRYAEIVSHGFREPDRGYNYNRYKKYMKEGPSE